MEIVIREFHEYQEISLWSAILIPYFRCINHKERTINPNWVFGLVWRRIWRTLNFGCQCWFLLVVWSLRSVQLKNFSKGKKVQWKNRNQRESRKKKKKLRGVFQNDNWISPYLSYRVHYGLIWYSYWPGNPIRNFFCNLFRSGWKIILYRIKWRIRRWGWKLGRSANSHRIKICWNSSTYQ